MKLDLDITDPRIVRALAHPLRVRLLALLEERTASPRDLAAELGLPIPNVSYHVRTLERLGLVELVAQTSNRGAVKHHYRAVGRPVFTDRAWSNAPSLAKQAVIGAALSQVSDDVNAAAEAGGFDRGDIHFSRSPMLVDRIGWAEASQELERVLRRLEQIAKSSEERLQAQGHGDDSQRAMVVMMLFESEDVPVRTATRKSPRRRRQPDPHGA